MALETRPVGPIAYDVGDPTCRAYSLSALETRPVGPIASAFQYTHRVPHSQLHYIALEWPQSGLHKFEVAFFNFIMFTVAYTITKNMQPLQFLRLLNYTCGRVDICYRYLWSCGYVTVFAAAYMIFTFLWLA